MTLNVFFTNSFDSQKFTTNDIVMMVLAWILDNTFIDKLKYDRQIHLPLAEFSKLNLKNLSPKLGEKFALFINWTHGLKRGMVYFFRKSRVETASQNNYLHTVYKHETLIYSI